MYNYILANVIGGLCVLTSYSIFLPLMSNDKLWASLSTTYKIYTIISIMIAVFAFISCFSIIVRYKEDISTNLLIGLTLFYLGASLWTPSLYYNNKICVLLALIFTTAGALLMTLYSPTMITKLLMLIVFLHCLITDNVIWYSSYIKE